MKGYIFLLFLLFFIAVHSSFAVLDLRDVQYEKIADEQAKAFPLTGAVVYASDQGTPTRLSGFAEPRTLQGKRLKKEYGGEYWRKRAYAIQELVDPLEPDIEKESPSSVLWKEIKIQHRQTLLEPSSQRNLNEEYGQHWIERALQTYDYLAVQNPALLQKKLQPLLSYNLQEFLPYWTEVKGKRALNADYDALYWQGKEKTSDVTFTTV